MVFKVVSIIFSISISISRKFPPTIHPFYTRIYPLFSPIYFLPYTTFLNVPAPSFSYTSLTLRVIEEWQLEIVFWLIVMHWHRTADNVMCNVINIRLLSIYFLVVSFPTSPLIFSFFDEFSWRHTWQFSLSPLTPEHGSYSQPLKAASILWAVSLCIMSHSLHLVLPHPHSA